MDTSSLKKTAIDAIDAAASQLHDISKDIWNKPELGFNEHSAHALLTDFLENHGFQVERNYILETGFRATLGDVTSGPHVAVMCEYDALPGIGHACGHNLIAEVGIATALGVQAAMTAAGKPIGKLTVLGTPAEEGGGGKLYMVDSGFFSDVTVAMMAHPSKWNLSWKPFLYIQSVKITFKGRASHAAGFPWEGVNALDAAVMAYSNVSCMRQQMKPAWRVHGVITNGGEKPNIIPEVATMEYYIRTPTMGEMGKLREKVIGCFNAAATATGCTVELEWDTRPYENVINNSTLCHLYEENAHKLDIKFSDMDKQSIPTGSTDFGNVSHVVPGIHPMFFIGEDVMNHTREFTTVSGMDKAQPYTLDQGKALAMTAIDVLCNPELVPKLKKELEEDLAKDAMA